MFRLFTATVFVLAFLSSTAFSTEGNSGCMKGGSEISVSGKNAEEKKVDCEKHEGTWSENKPAEKKEQSAGGGGGW